MEAPTSITLCIFVLLLVAAARAEDPYRFYTWNVTFGDVYPLGVKQQGILINGQFPGPQIDAVTNDNIVINVFNNLPAPFLLSWQGIQQRRSSWQDGVYGTNCPIPPGGNFTYNMQFKDQIGSYYYFPSLAFHKAAGGYGGIRVLSRPRIPVPFDPPAGDFTILAGDWFKLNHTDLKGILDSGNDLPFPDGLLINGQGWNGNRFTVDQGKTYRFRVSNVGISTSVNIRIQGHSLLLVEVEGSHTMQNTYSSLDVHLGQSYSFLVTADQPPQDYTIVVSTRFTNPVLSNTAMLHYSNSNGVPAALPPPPGPTIEIDWSLNQNYNLRDAIARYTLQVYPGAWTAIYMPLDNVGMWNVRSESWGRQYLGQQFYLRVYSPANSWRDENPIPKNALLCGRASGRRTRPL
uniref:L-ascorbate oxidase homolog n=1 Tax=Hordeum vulgare subsp. vulgare TaxID=112509 RepID=A0A8I7BJW3_HORVV